jgi:transposase
MTLVPPIQISDEERAILIVWSRLPPPSRLRMRAKIVLMAVDGSTIPVIAAALQTSGRTISLWHKRFLEGRLAAIEKEAPRGKQKSHADTALVRLILKKTRQRPADAARWTTRSLAKELGVSPSKVQRVWKAYGM